MITQGHLYIAQPPLYRIPHGRELRYAYTDAERDTIDQGGSTAEVEVNRYKGLGEMTAQQLWETTMDPTDAQDAARGDRGRHRRRQTIDMCLGADVAPRKRWIQTHAREVKNLDTVS